MGSSASSASYEFNYNGYKIITQLNVDNLFDKTYFTTGGLGPPSFDAFNPCGSGAFFSTRSRRGGACRTTIST